ncbi:MAG: SGNH/GDSL hydrolase family protein [Oscillospiraceae bacterium]|jgi:lysophospholipase L1-like esterase|nr:SGNH/GDSL hydrolase family protein [Oscillospiraceae bacterium]
MKNVLLLGDSIRLLYQPLVQARLRDRAAVYGPAENGRWSGYTLNSLRFWLPMDSPWSPADALPIPDIVHWNNGIWDMGDDYGLGRPFTSPYEYVSALERTITVLRKLCGEKVAIIMATTTPTADTDPSAPHEYNELLKQVAARNGIEVNDLFTAIASDIPANISPDRIHLTESGTAIAAAQVTACIERYL